MILEILERASPASECAIKKSGCRITVKGVCLSCGILLCSNPGCCKVETFEQEESPLPRARPKLFLPSPARPQAVALPPKGFYCPECKPKG